MKVWTYWKCNCCNNIIRGDSRTCPACGQPIPDNVKYIMPDDPAAIEAVENGTVLIGNENSSSVKSTVKFTDENGVTSDVVPEELESDKPNWNCNYCGYQNRFENTECEGCGAGKEEATSDYFGNRPVMDEKNRNDYKDRTGLDYEAPETIPEPETTIPPSKIKSLLERVLEWFKDNAKSIAIACSAVVGIIFLIWLFSPVTRTATVSGFSWERSIDVETYTLCHEDGWSVPSGAHVTSQKEEIHHYDSVLDHYETKTRQVSERVLDGYDTSYRDLGNGQAEVVKTPRYKTVYHTETYQDPVYKQVPVYKTKYYYDIGRWKQTSSLDTSGSDKNPYWHETNIPSSVSNPSYGDKRLGSKHETYSVLVFENDEAHLVPYNYSTWMELEMGQEIQYKTFRFSHTPLYGK